MTTRLLIPHNDISQFVKLQITSRHAFVASPGHVLISCDFANQEMLTAAVLSQDPVMLDAFRLPKELQVTLEDGSVVTYVNHLADLHTLTATNCFPEVFVNKKEWEYVSAAKEIAPGRKRSPRDYSKFINFG